MFGKEPAVIISAAVAIAQGVLIFVTGDVAAQVWPWFVPALTFLGGIVTRQNVVPSQRLEERGIDPDTLLRN
jgi:4-hydroxybenzoate polyprenyltransferase